MFNLFLTSTSYIGSSGEVWLKQKDEKEIIPAELRERDFKTLPSRETKTEGPQFGINAGDVEITLSCICLCQV